MNADAVPADAGHADTTDASGREDHVITLQQVHKAFGPVVAVREADLGIRKGEFFSLLGPSGCGKTTILRMIAGFEQPTSGRVLLDGRDVSSVPPHKRNVNTVFQQYALFPHMTVFDNVAFGPRSRGERDGSVRPKVLAMLDTVRLADLADRRPAQLSGGQQQRVALARALVNLPSALLLDEPLAALDLKLRHAMQLELKRIQREVGITFVFVTHDQEEALTMSDRIGVMNHGRVEQVGTPREVYDTPATLFVAGFIGTANLLPATVRDAAGGRVRATLAGGVDVEADGRGVAFSSGAAVTVMLRPEHLALVAERPAETPSIPVVVEQLVFQGPSVRAALRTTEGVPLLAHLVGGASGAGVGGPTETPAIGGKAWVTWPGRAAYVLPEAAANAGATGLDVDEVEASL